MLKRDGNGGEGGAEQRPAEVEMNEWARGKSDGGEGKYRE